MDGSDSAKREGGGIRLCCGSGMDPDSFGLVDPDQGESGQAKIVPKKRKKEKKFHV
jgi:hypothetical protein